MLLHPHTHTPPHRRAHMALPNLVLPLLLLSFFSPGATQPPRTLHIPVIHRDSLFPPVPGAATPSSLLLRLLATDATHYTVQLAPSLHYSTAAADDRLRSPVISGLPFDSGEYFAVIGVGFPPTRALVVIDTGSDLTWLQCAPCRHCYRQLTPLYDPRGSTTHNHIPCASPRCRGVLRYPGCDGDARTGACVYMVVYGDGSASTGHLATDTLVFPGDDAHVHHNVTIGCGHDNGGLFESAAGLLGVGRGELSFPTQAAPAYGRVFSYCLGGRTTRASTSAAYLVFGRAPEPASTAYTPLRTNPRRPSLYYVDMDGISVGGERVVAGFSGASGLALDAATGRGGVVVDSGTAISRFAGDAYAAVRDAFDARAAAGGARRVVVVGAANLSALDACYDLRGGGGRGDATVRVPSVVLHFASGADMVLPPANYLVPVEGGDRRTYFCLGLQAADDGLNVLGNVQQQGFGVTFDVERGRIGFAPNACSA